MHGDIVSNVRENLHYLDVSIFNHILSGSVDKVSKNMMIGIIAAIVVVLVIVVMMTRKKKTSK